MYNYVSNNFWFTFLASVQGYDVNNPSDREKSFWLLCHGRKISRSQQTKIYLYIILTSMTFVCMIALRNKMEPNFSSIVWLSKWPSLSRTIRLINFSNRTGTSVDDGNAHGKDWTRLPVPNLPLCHWSSQLFGLHMHSSTDVPVLLLNQPIVQVQWWYHHGNVMWQILLSLSPRGAREDGLV